MHIKSIILDGFKSYGQRTEIHGFDPQFNAITGLNGTGKSNILDSVCFVLGITNLTQVRANSLQDLIYKNGQAGVNAATVSIIFDNSNKDQSPPGFDDLHEITITRQVVMGGKNKYLINGLTAQNKKVQDLFCSIQLNVNNPHFLIMQGRVTKVLNMKPVEVLSMVEEAAGTKLYETKRQTVLKTISKKDEKLCDMTTLIKEELAPKLEKLYKERESYAEYQRNERELTHLQTLYRAWEYVSTQKNSKLAEETLKEAELVVQKLQDNIATNITAMKTIDMEVTELSKATESVTSNKLSELEAALKEKVKTEAKAAASEISAKENIISEEKKKEQLKKELRSDEAALKTQEEKLNQVRSLFEKLKENDASAKEAVAACQRKFEALSAGMEVNDEGETQTLQEQLMIAKQEASQANTEIKKANMQLDFCRTQLQQKEKELGSNTSDYVADQNLYNKAEIEVKNLEKKLLKIGYSEEKMQQLQQNKHALTQEIRGVKEKIRNFNACRPHVNFNYTDPEPNWNKRNVHGVVCRLFNCRDKISCTALETAAGGKLYNVIVETHVASKLLLERGQLQQRTTFVPLNQIKSSKISDDVLNYAKSLVGAENVDSALSLITYDKKLRVAMEYVFGNVLICKDLDVAKKVAFHNRIRKRCVTLDGDVVDPAGTLSGGAAQKGEPILSQIAKILEEEATMDEKQKMLHGVEEELQRLSEGQEKYKHTLELKQHELEMIKRRLQQSTHHKQKEEISNLQANITELIANIEKYKEMEAKNNDKIKDLSFKMKDYKGHQKTQLEETKAEMSKLKLQADKSNKEWKKHEQEYETLTLEITELQKATENVRQQIATSEENLEKLQKEHEELGARAAAVKQELHEIQTQVKEEKSTIAAQNREIQKKLGQKEKLTTENSKLELQIKKQDQEISKRQEELKLWKAKVKELSKKVPPENANNKEIEEMTNEEAKNLEKRIRTAQEKKNKLGRTVNAKAQFAFEHEEKQYNELLKRKHIVETDKKKLLNVISDLDDKKKEALDLAYKQVRKDFGSIFSTLLPGSDATLQPPLGKSVLEGLEIKVSLGGVWKESLTELSGGQRSLVALSLILAMLLFKPAPLYILDEVDAALDLSHTQNIGNMLRKHFKQSQFLIVSLKDGMFNNANVLFRTKFIDGMSAVTRTVNKSNS